MRGCSSGRPAELRAERQRRSLRPFAEVWLLDADEAGGCSRISSRTERWERDVTGALDSRKEAPVSRDLVLDRAGGAVDGSVDLRVFERQLQRRHSVLLSAPQERGAGVSNSLELVRPDLPLLPKVAEECFREGSVEYNDSDGVAGESSTRLHSPSHFGADSSARRSKEAISSVRSESKRTSSSSVEDGCVDGEERQLFVSQSCREDESDPSEELSSV